MTNKKLTFFFNDTRYLIYLLPKELKQGNILNPVFLQQKKKEADVFLPYVNLSTSVPFHEILSSVESRSRVYDKGFNPSGLSFSFCLNNISASGINLSPRKKKLKQHLSFFQLLRFREFFHSNLGKSSIMKSRCLSIKKGGYSLSYYGCRALFYPSLFSKKKMSTFGGWFSQNLLQYGFLQAFSLSKWKINQISRHHVNDLSTSLPIYYSSLPKFRSFVVLSKPKCSIRKRK